MLTSNLSDLILKIIVIGNLHYIPHKHYLAASLLKRYLGTTSIPELSNIL